MIEVETVRRWQMEGCYGVVLEYVFTEIPSKEENRGGIKREALIRLKPAHDTRGYRDIPRNLILS